MKKSNLQILLELISIRWNIFQITEERDKKLIVALSFMLYVSCVLGGYSIYVSVYFLLKNFFLASLLGLFTTGFLILHDQSLMATEKRIQIVSKVVISLCLAIAFVLTNSATKEYDSLSLELHEVVEIHNSEVRLSMNTAIESIENEERGILRRIEQAGEMAKSNIQPLVDARRSLEAFRSSKEDRINRIKEAYASQFQEAKISDLNILSLQTSKMLNGESVTVISLVLAFLFFLLESLPAIIRLMLDNSDYMIRYIASLKVNRDLRNQNINEQREFTSKTGNIIKSLLTMDLLEQKRLAILSNFINHDALVLLDTKIKLLAANINPYTGKSLDYVDREFFSSGTDRDHQAHEEEAEKKSDPNARESQRKEEPVFNI